MISNKLIFVCGIARSGTTLLSSLINTSKNTVTFAELIPIPGFNIKDFNINNLTNLEYKKQYKKFFCVKKITKKNIFDCNKEYIKEYKITLLNSPEERIHYATSMALNLTKKINPTNNSRVSLKLNNTSFELTKKLFPDAKFVFIERGLTDNIQSHINAEFKKTEEKVKEQWNIYSQKWLAFMKSNPKNCLRIKYENLSISPLKTSRILFEFLCTDFENNHLLISDKKNVANFIGHINFNKLSKGISSYNVPYKKIDRKVNEVSCFKDNFRHSFSRPCPNLLKIKSSYLDKMNKVFLTKRKYSIDKYTELLEKFKDSINLRIFEFSKLKNIDKTNSVLIIRHDIDQDISNAVKLAKYEHSIGIRASYSILHSAWYFGELKDNQYNHSNILLDACYDILAYGHEIILHNNLVVCGLKYGIDIKKVLSSEINFFHENDVPIVGLSTYDDSMCKEFGFKNWEIFYDPYGEKVCTPRSVIFKNNEIKLGQFKYDDFGLEYDNFDFLKNYYLIDSEGEIKERVNEKENDRFLYYGKKNNVNGILFNPIYCQI